MKKIFITVAMTVGMMFTTIAQEQTITMEMVPVYTIDIKERQINIATTYPIDIYIDDKVYQITRSGFHTIYFETNPLKILVLPHQEQ